MMSLDHLLGEAFVRWHVQPRGPLVTQQRLFQASRVVQGPGAVGVQKLGIYGDL